jgi:hypothetical protein
VVSMGAGVQAGSLSARRVTSAGVHMGCFVRQELLGLACTMMVPEI